MGDKYQIPFINTCIRHLAQRYGLSVQKAFHYLKRFQGIEFLLEFYDVLHLQSVDDTVDDILLYCKKHGGQLA